MGATDGYLAKLSDRDAPPAGPGPLLRRDQDRRPRARHRRVPDDPDLCALRAQLRLVAPDSGRDLPGPGDDLAAAGDGGRRIPRRAPIPLDEALPEGFPQIEAITSVDSGKTVVEHDGQPMCLEATYGVAGILPTCFALPFVRGNRQRPRCRTCNSIVLTRERGDPAVRHRPMRSAGRLSARRGAGQDTTTGSAACSATCRSNSQPYASASSFRRDLNQYPARHAWLGSNGVLHYVKLRPGTDAAAIKAAAARLRKKRNIPEDSAIR